MKRLALTVAATLSLALGVVTVATTTAAPPEARNFTAHLSGSEELPPVETRATGQAVFRLDRDGSALHYRLIVANIDGVVAAHIHLAPAGNNGPVVAFLFEVAAPSGRIDGVIATGTITEADLVGRLAGASLDDLLGEIRSGDAYVNVHTTEHPSGEIRGQIG